MTAITAITTPSPSVFCTAPYIPPDAIFALTAEYNADPSPTKVNLGQGTYRDNNGLPWVLPSVQEARRIINAKGLLHEYLPILGLKGLRDGAARLPDLVESPPPLLSLGFRVIPFSYYKSATKTLDIDSYLSSLQSAGPGSVVILHACAHNPTSLDSTISGPDAAYLGFNSGNYDRDAWAIRYFVNELEVECAVCLSFAKNMGLYETILSDDRLMNIWFEDLKTMSGRIAAMRRALFAGLNRYSPRRNWDHLVRQSGMFGFLGLERDAVRVLKDEYHSYTAENSRVSIAGLNTGNVEYVARSIGEVLAREQ
ncbi:pyridoxal phosphate-dependent transferase [Aspergillus desertorum]